MDIQLKKGLLEYCVLAVLSAEDSYGYKIIGNISPVVKISESTLYPVLKRLETDGCLSTYSLAVDGRLRKYYRITEAGLERLRGFPQDWDELEKVSRFIMRYLEQEDEKQ